MEELPAPGPQKFSNGHTAEQTGPHSIAEGWTEAAAAFVKPADAKLLSKA